MRIIIRNTTLALGLITCFAILYNFSSTLQPSFEKIKKTWDKSYTEEEAKDEASMVIKQCSTEQINSDQEGKSENKIVSSHKNPLESNIVAHLWSVSANEDPESSRESEKAQRNPIAIRSLVQSIFRQARN